jgi:hypothetical protein
MVALADRGNVVERPVKDVEKVDRRPWDFEAKPM